MTKLMPPIMTDEMIEAALPVIAKYKSVQDVYTAVYNAVPNVEQDQSTRITELEAQLAEAKELLKGARSDLDYLIMPKGNINADIRNDYVIDRKERIDEFLKGEE